MAPFLFFSSPWSKSPRGVTLNAANHLACCKSPQAVTKVFRRVSARLNKREIDPLDPAIPWNLILDHLDCPDIMNFSQTSHYFHDMAHHESVWESLYLRKFEVDAPLQRPAFSWKSLFKSQNSTTHSYSKMDTTKHLDWMRIGAFTISSGKAVATHSLEEKMDPRSCWTFDNAKTGIWIADLHLVRCPVCNLQNCEGTMQVLEARHSELFLMDDWNKSGLSFKTIGRREISWTCAKAAAAIFDQEQISDPASQDVLDTKSWSGSKGDWQPRGIVAKTATAICTNLQPNEGISITCDTLQAGEKGTILAIRIAQQLL